MYKQLGFHNQDGLTLIEVIIGTALLGIMFIMFINFFSTTYYWTIQSRDRTDNLASSQSLVENALGDVDVSVLDQDGVDYDDTTLVDAVVKFNGSAYNQTIHTKKIVAEKETTSANNAKIKAGVTGYQPQ